MLYIVIKINFISYLIIRLSRLKNNNLLVRGLIKIVVMMDVFVRVFIMKFKLDIWFCWMVLVLCLYVYN